MDKVERNGKVAVLVSPGFGAGWSTWTDNDDQREWALFAPEVVAWVEGGKVGDVDYIVKHKFGDEGFYSGGGEDLEIEWIAKGTAFRINEYGGSETIITNDTQGWSIA